MKCLIVLALAAMAHAAPQYYSSFAIPTVLPDGHHADTPEVALAKIAHFAEHARALPAAHAAIAAAPSVVTSPYISGPFAISTILSDGHGHLADTPEVAAAKIAHLSQHAITLANDPDHIAAAPSAIAVAPATAIAAGPVVSQAVVSTPFVRSIYSGPYAIPTVLPSGHLADTPEVAAAKIAHLSQHAITLANDPDRIAAAPSAIAAAPDAIATGPVASQAVVSTPFVRSIYSGPYAIPTILPSGHLADTPEVSAAKAFHFNAHAHALSD